MPELEAVKPVRKAGYVQTGSLHDRRQAKLEQEEKELEELLAAQKAGAEATPEEDPEEETQDAEPEQEEEVKAEAQDDDDPDSEPEPLAEYVGIDIQKVDALPESDVYELHKSGFLSAIYLQHYSLENWRHLMARREQRGV